MIFTQLVLENFGRFYGRQALRLAPGVYVLHGRNGLGKTTLLNAVRWVLYGHYRDRQDRAVPPEVMLNRPARREGTRQFSVELTIEEGSDSYLIRRTQVVSEVSSPPSEMYVERNGLPVTAADQVRVVAHLLNEDISRFFLFDGEQLQKYESLLLHEDTASQLIKQSIEQILGLPVLEDAIRDLAAVKDELGKRLARQARQTQKLQQVGARAEQLQAKLDTKRKEIEELRALDDVQRQIIKDRDEFLLRYEDSMEALKNLEAVESQVVDLTERIGQLRALLGEEMRYVWRDVLATALAPRLDQLQEAQAQQEREAARRHIHDAAQRSIDDGRCALCGEPLSQERITALKQTLLTEGEATLAADMAVVDQLMQLPVLAKVTLTGHSDTAVRLDREIAGLQSREVILRQEASRLREALQNVPEQQVATAAKERNEAYEAAGRLGELLKRTEEERQTTEEQLRRAQDEIRKEADATGDPHLGRGLGLADDLLTVFQAAKLKYRDELRIAVEQSASEAFAELTSEPAFERLRINDGYGLEIIDDRGDVVAGRSAGQEQIVALSLVAALNRNATRRAPVMMDTPFGRLDPEHRARVLRFLSRFANQVFLLVHGGEVQDADLAVIANDIRERYDLHRDAPDRTTIMVRSAV